MRTPAHPCCTAWRVSSIVSLSEQQPVPGIRRSGWTPAETSFSRKSCLSETEHEFASDVVPNTTSPSQPFCRSHWQWVTERSASSSARVVNAVKTGARTPLSLDAVIHNCEPGVRALQATPRGCNAVVYKRRRRSRQGRTALRNPSVPQPLGAAAGAVRPSSPSKSCRPTAFGQLL